MRNLIFLLVFMMVSCSSTKKVSTINENFISFKILKIKDEKSFHIIYAERNDSIFQIFSDKIIASFDNCEKIKKGEQYYLQLTKILPPDSLLGIPYHTNLGVKTNWDKYIKKEFHYKVYKADNLKGLCLIKEDE